MHGRDWYFCAVTAQKHIGTMGNSNSSPSTPPSPAGNTPGAALDGNDSDSDVEYDCETLTVPTPNTDLEDVGRYTRPADDSSIPLWAAGGAADEPCFASLQLQFVYGLRCTDSRRNVYFTASGEVAFHSASLVVLYEPRRHTQRFLRGHDGEIRCLALHPSGRVFASGQSAGGHTEICVWQLDSSENAAVLAGPHAAGVTALSFSPSGERLASLGADSSLSLWDWKRGDILASCSAHSEPLFALAWSPVEPALATVGVRCVKLWGVGAEERGLVGHSAQTRPGEPTLPRSENDGGGAAEARRGDEQETFLCCTFLQNGLLVAGTSRGEVWCWSGMSLNVRFRAHDGPIFCLETERTEGWLLSGGKDGRLRMWSPSVWSSTFRGTNSASGNQAPMPLRMIDLRKLATALADSAGRPRLLGEHATRTRAHVSSSVDLLRSSLQASHASARCTGWALPF